MINNSRQHRYYIMHMILINSIKIRIKENIVERITCLCDALKVLFTVDEMICL